MRTKMILLAALVVLLTAPGAVSAALSAQGRVVDMQENPVPRIKVYALMVYYTDDYQAKSSLKAATLTNGEGKWEFESLPTPLESHIYWGYYFVAFQPGARLGWTLGAGDLMSVPNAPAAPEDGYLIPAAKLGTFEGRVTDWNDNPIAGVTAKTAVLLELDEECDPGG